MSGLLPSLDSPPAQSARRSNARRGVMRLGLVMFGLLLALIVAEVGLRLVRPFSTWQRLPLSYEVRALALSRAGQNYVHFDADLGWTTTPDFRGQVRSTDYQNNHQGLRGVREYAPTPGPGIRRLSAYGDSFTYCDAVAARYCWTALLEQDPDTEVLNFGVPAYAPDQAWLRYQRDGAARKPCGVLLGVMVENINRVVNRFRPFYRPETGVPFAKPRFLLDGGRLTLLPSPARRDDLTDPRWVEANLGPRDAWYYPGIFVPNPLDWLEIVKLGRTADYRRSLALAGAAEASDAWAERYRPGSEALEVLAAVLIGFADQVRADGSTPVVLVFPTENEVSAARNGGPKIQAPLLAALAAHRVATIDLTDALAAPTRRVALKDLVVQHYTPLGNAVVAEALRDRLPPLLAPTCGRGATG